MCVRVCENDKSGKKPTVRRWAERGERKRSTGNQCAEWESKRRWKTKSNDLTTKNFLHFIRGYLSANVCHMIVRLVHILLVRCMLVVLNWYEFIWFWMVERLDDEKANERAYEKKDYSIWLLWSIELDNVLLIWLFCVCVCCLAVATLAAVFVLFVHFSGAHVFFLFKPF